MPNRLDDPLRIVRCKELADLLQVHVQTIWKWSRDKVLPEPIKIGPGVTGWRAVDIRRWLDSCKTCDGEPAKLAASPKNRRKNRKPIEPVALRPEILAKIEARRKGVV